MLIKKKKKKKKDSVKLTLAPKLGACIEDRRESGTEAKALLCATLKSSKKASINGHYLFGLFGVVFQNICCHFLAMTLQIITLNRPFSSSPGLCFKTRVGVQPLIRKSFFILMQIKLIFTIKVVHQASY